MIDELQEKKFSMPSSVHTLPNSDKAISRFPASIHFWIGVVLGIIYEYRDTSNLAMTSFFK